MSYRSLKRVLGETNLERKILLLFGACLSAMLGLAFWSVDRIGEKLVMETTHRKGRDWAQIALMKMHWDHWITTEERKLWQDNNNKFLPPGIESHILSERYHKPDVTEPPAN